MKTPSIFLAAIAVFAAIIATAPKASASPCHIKAPTSGHTVRRAVHMAIDRSQLAFAHSDPKEGTDEENWLTDIMEEPVPLNQADESYLIELQEPIEDTRIRLAMYPRDVLPIGATYKKKSASSVKKVPVLRRLFRRKKTGGKTETTVPLTPTVVRSGGE